MAPSARRSRFARDNDGRPGVLDVRTDRGTERANHLANLGRTHLTVLDAHLDQDRVDHEAMRLILFGDLEKALRFALLFDQRARGDGGIPLATGHQENDKAVDETVRDDHLRHH